MLSGRNIAVVVLAIVCIGAWYYAFTYFDKHKADIVIQLAEVTERLALPYKIMQLSALPEPVELVIPIRGVSQSDIEDTFGAPRGNDRTHEGLDIFADRWTPVFPLAPGYVIRKDTDNLGGNYVSIIGAGGKRYYYAHLDHFAPNVETGDYVTVDNVIGYVGDTGNATSTPYHLHFGVYTAGGAENPYQVLIERN